MNDETLPPDELLDYESANFTRGTYLSSFIEVEESLNLAILFYFVLGEETQSAFASCFLDPLPTKAKIDVLDHILKEEDYSGRKEVISLLRTTNTERGYFAHFQLLKLRDATVKKPWWFIASASRKPKYVQITLAEMDSRLSRPRRARAKMSDVLQFVLDRATNRMKQRAEWIIAESSAPETE